MGFRDKKNEINWKMHFTSSIDKVFEALTTDNGRAKFWAEETKEENGYIDFSILNYPKYKSKIIDKQHPSLFRLEYFETDVTFKLVTTNDDNGTDLILTALTYDEEVRTEMTAGWVSVLLAMKGAIDFGIDLRNHNPKRVWGNGYLDN